MRHFSLNFSIFCLYPMFSGCWETTVTIFTIMTRDAPSWMVLGYWDFWHILIDWCQRKWTSSNADPFISVLFCVLSPSSCCSPLWYSESTMRTFHCICTWKWVCECEKRFGHTCVTDSEEFWHVGWQNTQIGQALMLMNLVSNNLYLCCTTQLCHCVDSNSDMPSL